MSVEVKAGTLDVEPKKDISVSDLKTRRPRGVRAGRRLPTWNVQMHVTTATQTVLGSSSQITNRKLCVTFTLCRDVGGPQRNDNIGVQELNALLFLTTCN